jgi:hypothetical protein
MHGRRARTHFGPRDDGRGGRSCLRRTDAQLSFGDDRRPPSRAVSQPRHLIFVAGSSAGRRETFPLLSRQGETGRGRRRTPRRARRVARGNGDRRIDHPGPRRQAAPRRQGLAARGHRRIRQSALCHSRQRRPSQVSLGRTASSAHAGISQRSSYLGLCKPGDASQRSMAAAASFATAFSIR